MFKNTITVLFPMLLPQFASAELILAKPAKFNQTQDCLQTGENCVYPEYTYDVVLKSDLNTVNETTASLLKKYIELLDKQNENEKLFKSHQDMIMKKPKVSAADLLKDPQFKKELIEALKDELNKN